MPKTTYLQIRIEPELKDRLLQHVEKTQPQFSSASHLVTVLISQYLDRNNQKEFTMTKIEIGQTWKHNIDGEERTVCKIGNDNTKFPAAGELDGRNDLIWFDHSRFAETPEGLKSRYRLVSETRTAGPQQ